ncbi:acyltransferase family protein [Nocardioides marmorisolisilvae]|uniref:Acyltransferase n=1 Tax=Nocardioides marmorisolisilvae TaxID=1542737 RepID=A0A3N0DRI9_9ACTN|nr:acyltransferase [Nocardioides marmorisolisilvae]RNL78254.1 acyltransferase [Nocardioides marmorisolisilvae]
MPNTRERGLDAVRVLAMVAIVAGHLWTTSAWVRPVLYTWHVPVFFFLTGFLWNERRGLLAEVRQRTLTVLLPFTAWVVLLTLVVNHGRFWPALHEVALEAWHADGFVRPFWAFWFALALFFSTLLYRAITPLPWTARVAVVIAATVAVATAASTGHHLALDLGQGVLGTGWILAGHALRATSRRAQRRWGEWHDLRSYRAALGALLLVGAALGIAASPTALDVDLGRLDLGAPVVSVLVSLVICAGLVLLGSAVPGSSVPAITTDLARAALVVMLVHLAVIDQVGALAHRSVGELVVVLAAAWGIGLVLLGVPRTWWLTGQRERPAAPLKTSQRIPQPAPAHAE